MNARSLAFDQIYKRNAWNGTETRSGPGSTLAATRVIARVLPELCEGLGVTSVLDASCGESNWMPDLPGYVGVDISESALEVSRRRHPERSFVLADICSDPLPQADLVFCRDALQHLTVWEGLAAVQNFRSTGACWLVCSTHEGGTNANDRTGGYYTPDMEEPPFLLGPPWMVIEDGFWDHGVKFPDKYLGVWACAW